MRNAYVFVQLQMDGKVQLESVQLQMPSLRLLAE